jgi:hypothetical protein
MPRSTTSAFSRSVRTGRPKRILLSIVSLLVLGSLAVAGCKESISNIGGPFFPDKISQKTLTLSDTNVLKLSNFVRTTVQSPVHSYNVNSFGTTLFVGKVKDAAASEDLQVWSLLRFQSITADTLANVDSIRLQLRLIAYRYGDPSSTHVDVSVYAETKQKVNDSTSSLLLSDLNPTPLGSFVGDISSDSTPTISIKLDTALYKKLDLSTVAFVVVPNTMTTVRGFGASETGTTGFAPSMEYNVHQPSASELVTTRPAVFDYHLVQDASTVPSGEFSLRGSASRRELVAVALSTLNNASDSISGFSTVNSAVLVLKLDPARTRHSANAGDTLGPAIVQLYAPSSSDSLGLLVAYGTADRADPTIYRFQIRTLIEQWLRFPDKNFGFEVRAGYVLRGFGTRLDTVDDFTLNRFTFFGSDATDTTKRPSLILTYSILK